MLGCEGIMSFILFFLPAIICFALIGLNEIRISRRWQKLFRRVYGDPDTQ